MTMHSLIPKTFQKLKQGDFYRLKGTKDIFRISRKNHSILVQHSDKYEIIEHRYSVSLRLVKQFSERVNYREVRTLSIVKLDEYYIRLSAKKARTLKILFGDK